MSFATITSLVTAILCIAVLVQCARVMRSLAAFRAADLPGTARALDTATASAHHVLSELKTELDRSGEPTLRALAEARAIADELGVMIGIGNATADRLLDSARNSRASLGETLDQQDLAA